VVPGPVETAPRRSEATPVAVDFSVTFEVLTIKDVTIPKIGLVAAAQVTYLALPVVPGWIASPIETG
jgi:hypothetical protein